MNMLTYLLPIADSENIQQLQKFNTKLIENILPAHVAKHYLGMDRLQDVSNKNTSL